MSNLLRSTTIYTVGNIIPKLVGFFLLPIYTRYMTPSDYGLVNSMEVLSGVMLVILTLALDRSIYRMYFDYDNDNEKLVLLGTLNIALFAFSTVITLLTVLFKDYIQLIYRSIEFYPYYFITIISVYLSIFSLLPRALMQLKNLPYQFVGISLLQLVIGSMFALWFIVANHEGALGMLKSYLYTNLLLTPLYLWITAKSCVFKFERKMFVDSVKFSMPLAPSLLSAWVLNLSDRIFIERYFNTNDVGIYSLGYKVAGLILIFISAFNSAYTPYFYKMANSEDQVHAKAMLSKYNTCYVLILMFIGFLPALFSKEIVFVVASAKYAEAANVIPLISLSYLFINFNSLVNMQIYQVKKTAVVMLLVGASAIVNIALNFYFIPLFGIYGAALSIILTQIIYFIINYSYSMKCYHIPYQWTKISLLFIALMSLYGLFSGVKYCLVSSIVKLIIVFIGILIVYKYYISFKKQLS